MRDIKIKYYDEEIDIFNEKAKVHEINHTITLDKIPSNRKISVKQGITDLYETENDPNINEFKVDRTNGTILFNSAMAGKIVVIDYSAIGKFCISTDKVYTNIDNKGNVIETLEDFFNKNQKIINSVEAIGDGATVLNKLQANIDSLTSMSGYIVSAKEFNEDLVNNIEVANVSNGNLNSTIKNANSKLNELDGWLESHGDITDLDNRVDKIETISEKYVACKDYDNETINIEFPTLDTDVKELKKSVEKKIDINEDIYYDEIKIEKLRDEISGTTYWLTTIPHLDKNGNIIKLKTGVSEYYETHPNRHESNGTGTDYNNNPNLETARDFSKRKKASLVVNAGCWGDTGAHGTFIVDGEIKAEVDMSAYYRVPLGIKEDNTLMYFDPDVNGEAMLSQGAVNVLTAFQPIIVNGEKYNGKVNGTQANWTAKHPRNFIGQRADKSFVFITTDGRTDGEAGMSYEDEYRILKSLDCVFGYNLDGGGSVSLVNKHEFINNKIDGSRKQERKLYSFIYFSKEENKDYKSELSNEIIQTNISIGNLKSLIQNVVVDVLNKTDMNLGYIRLKGTEGNIYQGIETWDGENKNCKLVLNKNQMRYYDYNNSRGMFNVDVNGNISTPKGTLGVFNSVPQSETNLDAISETGIYWCLYSATSAPFSACSAGILHFNINDNNKMQIAFPFTTDNETYKIKIRRTNASDGSWYDWKDF